jgi:hypothetical protein
MKLTKNQKRIISLALFRLQSDIAFQTMVDEVSGSFVFNQGKNMSMNSMIKNINNLQEIFK